MHSELEALSPLTCLDYFFPHLIMDFNQLIFINYFLLICLDISSLLVIVPWFRLKYKSLRFLEKLYTTICKLDYGSKVPPILIVEICKTQWKVMITNHIIPCIGKEHNNVKRHCSTHYFLSISGIFSHSCSISCRLCFFFCSRSTMAGNMAAAPWIGSTVNRQPRVLEENMIHEICEGRSERL